MRIDRFIEEFKSRLPRHMRCCGDSLKSNYSLPIKILDMFELAETLDQSYDGNFLDLMDELNIKIIDGNSPTTCNDIVVSYLKFDCLDYIYCFATIDDGEYKKYSWFRFIDDGKVLHHDCMQSYEQFIGIVKNIKNSNEVLNFHADDEIASEFMDSILYEDFLSLKMKVLGYCIVDGFIVRNININDNILLLSVKGNGELHHTIRGLP